MLATPWRSRGNSVRYTSSWQLNDRRHPKITVPPCHTASHDACRLLQSLVPQSTLSAKSALCIVSSAGETMCARPALFGQVDYDVQAVALWQLQTLLELDLVSADALRHLRRLYPIIEAGLNYSRLR